MSNIEIVCKDDSVSVFDEHGSERLRIGIVDRRDVNGVVYKKPIVMISSCLTTDFEKAENLVEAYVHAFREARIKSLTKSNE